jgi:ketosteroid isomerase-like protein
MKHVLLFGLTILTIGILATGCSGNNASATEPTKDSVAKFDPASLKATIEAKNTAFAKAFVTGDSATMVDNYTPDGKIFPPNAPAFIGRAAIAGLVSSYLKYGIKEFKDETTALYGNEDNLIEEGNYLMGDGKGKTLDKGKYLVIWRRIGTDWKVYSDIFNSSSPAAASK